jgi:SAM-dependent methyltransferase
MGFEDRAHGWLAWASTPGHDAYWRYRDAFFALVPAGQATLEVGCGEGRVSRDLAARGHRVTGLDAAPTLLRAAAEADPGSWYVEGTAEALPFADASFDLVIAYNGLMDVADMPAAVGEAARVLALGGRLCACVTHPLADAGSWRDDEHFAVTEPYLAQRDMHVSVQRDGLAFTFEGPAYSLQDYAAALEAAGLLIEALREPADPAGGQWARVPMFLMARRQGAVARPALAMRTWTWSSWCGIAMTMRRGPRRCRCRPTNSLTAPAARKRSTRS